jgi:hypothetical protein
MPIIDVYLWAALIVAIVVGQRTGKIRRWAQIALLFLVLDYGARASLHELALSDATAREANGGATACATLVHARQASSTARSTRSLTARVHSAAAPADVHLSFAWRVIRHLERP